MRDRSKEPYEQRRKMDSFNRRAPLGTLVEVTRDDGRKERRKVRSEAWMLAGHTAVVMLDGIRGGFALERCRILKKEELMTMTKVTIPTKSGKPIVLEGEGPEFQKMLEDLKILDPNDGLHYRSDSHGLIPMKSMATPHLKNAIAKIYRAWATELKDLDVATFLARLRTGPNDKTMLGLIEELATRRTKK
jgi:hypothetical protein